MIDELLDSKRLADAVKAALHAVEESLRAKGFENNSGAVIAVASGLIGAVMICNPHMSGERILALVRQGITAFNIRPTM